MDVITLTVNEREIQAERGKNVLEAALDAGIYIPHLCYLPRLRPFAGCRLCLVEIEGTRRPLTTACTQPAAEGMIVRTNTPEVVKMRREVLELLLSDHPDRCLTCPREVRCPPFSACQRDPEITDRCVICAKNEYCELQEVVDHVGVTQQRFYGMRPDYPLERTNPFIERDYNKCIACGRCVRACVEIRGVGAVDFAYRGDRMRITTAYEDEMKDSNCEFCGQCVLACPTGALMERVFKYAGLPDHTVNTVCTYCGCGCNIKVEIKGGRIIRMVPAVPNNVNENCLCVKGHFAYDFIQANARLTEPLIKRPGGALAKTNWGTALNTTAQKLKSIKDEYGPDAIGIISSAKCTNEENYLAQKLARAMIGTNNVDSCADLCHKPTLDALMPAFGVAAMSSSIADVEKAGCIAVIGSNTTETHPIVALRIKWAVQKGAKLIVVNPREIDLCRFAHVWLRNKPGTDVALINGLMQVIIEQELWDGAFVGQYTEKFVPLAIALQKYDLEYVSDVTGVAVEDIVTAARLLATGGRDPEYHMPPIYYGPLAEVGTHGDTDASCIIYGSGIAHHATGVDGVRVLANLAMLVGALGREGGGLNPLAGQNNVQGACDMGALPNYLPGYRQVEDAEARAELAKAWLGGDGDDLNPEPGLSLLDMLSAAKAGKIKALYIIGQNPMLSAPDQDYVRECLSALDLLVVQDIFFTETAQMADVVLPAASFAEKEGTFTNTERRVQRVRKVLDPPEGARPDWKIITQIAQRTRALEGKDDAQWTPANPLDFSGWNYAHPAQIMSEINRLVPIYGGMEYERLEDEGGLQWPCPRHGHPGTPILFRDGFGDRKGVFTLVEYRPLAERADKEYPFTLIIGRMLFHYHLGKMTMNSKGLVTARPHCYLEIHPDDAQQLGVDTGDMVRLASRRGEVTMWVEVTNRSAPGEVFTTFHYANSPVNRLTQHPLDGLLELKTCAVRIERIPGEEIEFPVPVRAGAILRSIPRLRSVARPRPSRG